MVLDKEKLIILSLSKTSDLSETYLRYIESELMGGRGGGRWIANFEIAIRRFNISMAKKVKIHQKKDLDLLVYGGVRQSGFLLSRAFSYLASPSYQVACIAIGLERVSQINWSSIVKWIREAQTIMEIMEFEWIWMLFFGKNMVPKPVASKIERQVQQNMAIIYADIQNKEIIHSDSFIARRGAKLFHPKNLEKRGFLTKSSAETTR
ncbi:MAG: hypothetical protein ACFFAE_16940 [Candidatus Hodarchaeota archaeon]